jgi:hypothetical protein
MSIKQYNDAGTFSTTLSAQPTANRTITIPDASGTLALVVSPALTGTPTAPTAAVGTNTNQIATTAFVLANASGSSSSSVPSASLTSYTFTATDGQTAFVTTGTTLSATPLVFLNGALQQITATYTVSGLTVTFVNARVANDSIVIVG